MIPREPTPFMYKSRMRIIQALAQNAASHQAVHHLWTH